MRRCRVPHVPSSRDKRLRVRVSSSVAHDEVAIRMNAMSERLRESGVYMVEDAGKVDNWIRSNGILHVFYLMIFFFFFFFFYIFLTGFLRFYKE